MPEAVEVVKAEPVVLVDKAVLEVQVVKVEQVVME